MESRLIHKVNPIYPESAKQAGVGGKVILTVTVNEEGSVSDIQHVSGHPLLNDAAIEAVKQWKYSPTLLNGKAVPVIATVTVFFQ
jgi:protein TonB